MYFNLTAPHSLESIYIVYYLYRGLLSKEQGKLCKRILEVKQMEYTGLICGGIGDRIWDKEFEIEANNFKEAVEKIYKDLEDGDIVEMKQKE